MKASITLSINCWRSDREANLLNKLVRALQKSTVEVTIELGKIYRVFEMVSDGFSNGEITKGTL